MKKRLMQVAFRSSESYKKCTLKNNKDPGQWSEILYHMEK